MKLQTYAAAFLPPIISWEFPSRIGRKVCSRTGLISILINLTCCKPDLERERYSAPTSLNATSAWREAITPLSARRVALSKRVPVSVIPKWRIIVETRRQKPFLLHPSFAWSLFEAECLSETRPVGIELKHFAVETPSRGPFGEDWNFPWLER
jgi:hypothetical protein